jgi:uncharacterized membrane protein
LENKKLAYAIVLAIITTFSTAIGQLLMKLGVNNAELSFASLIHNLPLIGGIMTYIIGGVIMIYALKYGDLSIVYPFFSLSFIWVALLSVLVLKENIHWIQGLGIMFIIAGVSFTGRGGSSRGEKDD